MHLRSARLCLDCDEIHDAQRCPACASESFAFLIRWVPVREQSQLRPPAQPPAVDPETVETYREMLDSGQRKGKLRAVGRGALGLALVGAAGWAWRFLSQPMAGDDGAPTDTDASDESAP